MTAEKQSSSCPGAFSLGSETRLAQPNRVYVSARRAIGAVSKVFGKLLRALARPEKLPALIRMCVYIQASSRSGPRKSLDEDLENARISHSNGRGVRAIGISELLGDLCDAEK